MKTSYAKFNSQLFSTIAKFSFLEKGLGSRVSALSFELFLQFHCSLCLRPFYSNTAQNVKFLQLKNKKNDAKI